MYSVSLSKFRQAVFTLAENIAQPKNQATKKTRVFVSGFETKKRKSMNR